MMRLVRDKEDLVSIECAGVRIEGSLVVPQGAKGVVLFAHGSGSSRHSPRNNFVAGELRKSSLGTLLIDLLTPEEDADYSTRFDIKLLTERLITATRWLEQDDRTKGLRIGYFGASTGAAAAIEASVKAGAEVGAIVSRGGRVDLAKDFIPELNAPSLFIVGENDGVVVELNKKCYELLKAEKELAVVQGAGHLFEEPGALERVAKLAAMWFSKHLAKKT